MAAAKKAQRRGRHAKVDFPEYGSRTDVGLVRDHNEDSLTVAPPVFAVADGMGTGRAAAVDGQRSPAKSPSKRLSKTHPTPPTAMRLRAPWSKRIARLFAPRSTGAANKAWEPP